MSSGSKTFSRYAITRKLGAAGPHVQVFGAVQSGLDREVELRVLNRRITDDEPGFVRFQREFQALAQLDHPALIKVLDLGAFDNRVYYTTGLRDAVDLADRVRELGGRLEPAAALELLLPVGEALSLMHSKGIVHRDVSMSSIRVDKVTGRAYLATFALLKILKLPSLTEKGFRAPQPGAAMTPEASEGWPEDERTDVFLFATVLYQALTGRSLPTPLEVAQGKGGSPFEFAPPSELVPGLSPKLDAALLPALSFKPEGRPATMELFVVELKRALQFLSAKEVARASGLPTQAMRATAAPSRGSSRGRTLRTQATGQGADLKSRGGLQGLVGIFAVLVLAVPFALTGGEEKGGPEIAPAAFRQVQVKALDQGAVKKQLEALTKELTVKATEPEDFEARWGVLRAFVKILPEEAKAKDFPSSVMANLRIAFFRDRKEACRKLDELLRRAGEISIALP